LYPRAFPLVRYELGDIICGANNDGNSVHVFTKVEGRDNDFLMIGSTPIHSEGITHAIKSTPSVEAYQIRYDKNNNYTIYLKSTVKIHEKEINAIKKNLAKIDEKLVDIPIVETDKLKQTIAGKTRWLISE